MSEKEKMTASAEQNQDVMETDMIDEEYPDDNVKDTTEVGEYTPDDIQVLEGLEAVRKRPGMYIGTTASRGLHHLVYEIVDNAVDEALAGFCTEITVVIQPDNSITVTDNGRGIPVGINHKTGRNAVDLVFTELHAGGKFGGGGYKVSGGLHGVGASVVNALSVWLDVEIRQGGKVYHERFSRGKTVTPLEEIGECPLEETGTRISFLPDPQIFKETTVFDYDVLRQRMREMAFLTRGLRINLCDTREDGDHTPVDQSFCYEGGIREFVTYLNHSKKPLYDTVMYFEGTKNNVYVEVAMQHNDSYTDSEYSFVNNINTPEGGMHLIGFRNAVTKTFNEYARKNKILKDSDANLTGEDIRERIIAAFCTYFENDYETYLQSGGMRLLKREYEENLTNLNREVQVLAPSGSWLGVAEGISDTGDLLVRDEAGVLQTVNSGEGSVRGVYGYAE